MYGKTVDEFEYKGEKFRWVLSPNGYIYQVWHGSDLVGGMPVSRVMNRFAPEAIKALYPLCDVWLENVVVVTGEINTGGGEGISGFAIDGSAFSGLAPSPARVKEAKAARAKAKNSK